MSHETFTLDELAQHLGQDRRKLEKLVNRGRLPGRKVGGDWVFHQQEITQWLEQELREYSERELVELEQSQFSDEVDAEIPVSSLLQLELVEVDLQGKTKRAVLEALIEVAGRTWQIWEPAAVLKAVQEREDFYSTAFENGVAIPHPRTPLPDAFGQSLLAFGKIPSGVPFGAPKRQLSDLFFLVLCRDSRTHLKVLARLGRMIQQPGFLDNLRSAETNAEAYQLICDLDQKIA